MDQRILYQRIPEILTFGEQETDATSASCTQKHTYSTIEDTEPGRMRIPCRQPEDQLEWLSGARR